MDFVEKTLREIAVAVEMSAYSSEFVERDGFLQSIEPRLKLSGLLGLIILVSFAEQIRLLIFYCFIPIIFSLLSKIELSFFLKRILVFIPIFALTLALPAIFNFVTPGDAILHLTKFKHTVFSLDGIYITKQGLHSALFLFLRITLSVAYSVLIVLTTKWTDIVYALRAFFVPWVVILILLMSYRYIFVFIRTVENFFIAKKSRSIKKSDALSGYEWTSNRIGILLKKSFDLSEGVYLSMQSKGYGKTSIITQKKPISANDYMWLFSVFSVVALSVLANMDIL